MNSIDISAGLLVATILLGAVLLVFTIIDKRVHRSRQRAIYILMLELIMADAFVECLGLWFLENDPETHQTALAVIYTITFELKILLLPCLVRYVTWVNGSVLKMLSRKWFLGLCVLPQLFPIACILSTPWTGFALRVDTGGPLRHSMFFVLVIMALFYCTWLLINTIRYQYLVPKTAVAAQVAAAFVILAGLVLQNIFPGLQVTSFAGMFAMLIALPSIENNDRLFEQTSRMPGRAAFQLRVQQVYALKQKTLCVTLRFTNLPFYTGILSADGAETLINQISDWIRKELSSYNMFLFQISPDRFVFLIYHHQSVEKKVLYQKIQNGLERIYVIEDRRIRLQAVVAPLSIPEEAPDEKSLTELLSMEDHAQRGTLTFLGEQDIARAEHELALVRCIRRVLKNHTLQVFYQPIWSVDTGTIVGAEALLRVNDPELGFVRPDEFVAAAERTGSIAAVDEEVLKQVCQMLKTDQPEQYGLEYVDINMSLKEMLTPDIAQNWADILGNYQILPKRIHIEFLETINDADTVRYEKVRKQLVDRGFSLSLDDFGTEYSNMSRLFGTRFAAIKLDKSMLWGEDTRPLLAALTRMLRKMGYDIIQEGVETKEQLEFVTRNGCNLIQGYYFSKPLPKDDFLSYIRTFNSNAKKQEEPEDEKKEDDRSE